MEPNGYPAYRLQLFFIANKELGSKSHQSDFQRALETGVDTKGFWGNFDHKGSGEYLITKLRLLNISTLLTGLVYHFSYMQT
jgi:hypothetical protein